MTLVHIYSVNKYYEYKEQVKLPENEESFSNDIRIDLHFMDCSFTFLSYNHISIDYPEKHI